MKNVLKYLKSNYAPHVWKNYFFWDQTTGDHPTKEAYRHVIIEGDMTYWYDFILWGDNEFCTQRSSKCDALYGMYSYPYTIFVGEIKTVKDLKTLMRILKIK